MAASLVVRGATDHNPDARSGFVLVVDDNPSTRMVLARALAVQGHDVIEAENGTRALEILRERRDRPFDVVLLDLLMPDLDGYQVLAQIRADESLRELPVIVVSAVDDVASAMRCVELGATDYLSKPINPALLKARLGAAVAERRLRDLEAQLELLTAAAQAVLNGGDVSRLAAALPGQG